jgi:thymidylate synthase
MPLNVRFEEQYLRLVERVFLSGEEVKGRNGTTLSLFGEVLTIDMQDGYFPLLQSRKMFYEGILGELAAFLRGPKTLKDFEDQGCNYWSKWANDDGTISVDYGNAWIDFNGVNQLDALRRLLKESPNDRRLLITGWNPGNLSSLSLPCCHLLYQWYVRDGAFLDMLWYQRSADSMIGIPSDIVLAAMMNILLANNVGLKPGKIKMIFGNTHIYEEHVPELRDYLKRRLFLTNSYPTYKLNMEPGQDMETFTAGMLELEGYNPMPAIKFELKA